MIQRRRICEKAVKMPESRRKLGSLEQNWDPRISAKNSEIIEKVMKKSNINCKVCGSKLPLEAILTLKNAPPSAQGFVRYNKNVQKI